MIITHRSCKQMVPGAIAGGDGATWVVDISADGDGVGISIMFSCKAWTVAFLLLPRVGATSVSSSNIKYHKKVTINIVYICKQYN